MVELSPLTADMMGTVDEVVDASVAATDRYVVAAAGSREARISMSSGGRLSERERRRWCDVDGYRRRRRTKCNVFVCQRWCDKGSGWMDRRVDGLQCASKGDDGVVK